MSDLIRLTDKARRFRLQSDERSLKGHHANPRHLNPHLNVRIACADLRHAIHVALHKNKLLPSQAVALLTRATYTPEHIKMIVKDMMSRPPRKQQKDCADPEG